MNRTCMAAVFLLACAAPPEPAKEAPPASDTEDADTAVDTDADADADTDADTAPDTATDSGEPPECDEIHGEGAPLAMPNACGTLTYGLYAAEGQTDAVHRLPDFSHAGYRGGGVALPAVADVQTVAPGSGDDRAAIQAAIDAVSARTPDADGHRGAVRIRAGTYRLDDSLEIKASGVVLRGDGQGPDGTILTATRPEQHSLIIVRGLGSGFSPDTATRTGIQDARVPVGATELEVGDASLLAVGDTIGVERTPNAAWIEALGVEAWGWTASSYAITHERTIVAIDGNTLTLDIPITDAMDSVHGGGAVFKADLSGRIEEVGIEDLRLVSTHRSATDEDHGWTAVEFRRARNSWVHGVSAVHFGYSAVLFTAESSFNTAEEVAMLEPVSQVTGGRRYSFHVSDGTGNLFQRCYSEDARHDFVTGSRVTGPNVWLDCLSVRSTNDDGPHHRWATGLLFDNVLSYKLHVENRQDSGSGHGWSGAQTLFWNTVSEDIRADAPPGAMNWTIGSMGTQQEGGWAPDEPFGWWESHNTPVEPRSLYLQQLQARLGPDAVRAVTTEAQRAGRLWGQLGAWAGAGDLTGFTPGTGDPTCSSGIPNGLACCRAECGECGGTGCGGRPGGAAACWTGAIA